jgi:hypothetical protein
MLRTRQFIFLHESLCTRRMIALSTPGELAFYHFLLAILGAGGGFVRGYEFPSLAALEAGSVAFFTEFAHPSLRDPLHDDFDLGFLVLIGRGGVVADIQLTVLALGVPGVAAVPRAEPATALLLTVPAQNSGTTVGSENLELALVLFVIGLRKNFILRLVISGTCR